jgi:hypothetical protein
MGPYSDNAHGLKSYGHKNAPSSKRLNARELRFPKYLPLLNALELCTMKIGAGLSANVSYDKYISSTQPPFFMPSWDVS